MIRPAKQSDLQQVRAIMNDMNLLTVSRRDPSLRQVAFDPREAQEAGRIHVFMDHTTIAGLTVFWEDGMALHIQFFVVDPKYKQRGVGQALLTHLDQIALADHCLRVILHPGANVFEVTSFCRARGFLQIDKRMLDGHECLYFERSLQ